MALDRYANRSKQKIDPIDGSQDIVIGVPFANTSTHIYLGTAGDVTVEYPDTSTQVFKSLAVGVLHKIRCSEITAGPLDMVACWS